MGAPRWAALLQTLQKGEDSESPGVRAHVRVCAHTRVAELLSHDCDTSGEHLTPVGVHQDVLSCTSGPSWRMADTGHKALVGSYFRDRLAEASVMADQVGSDLCFPVTGPPTERPRHQQLIRT